MSGADQNRTGGTYSGLWGLIKTNQKHNQAKYTEYKPHHPFIYTTASCSKTFAVFFVCVITQIYTTIYICCIFYMCNYPITQIYTTASCWKLPNHQFSPVNHTMHQNPSQAKYKTPSFESVFKLTPSAKLSQARPNIQPAPAPAPSTTCIDNLVNLCHQPFLSAKNI